MPARDRTSRLVRRIRVAKSARHGRGVFALQRFQPGRGIGRFEGRPTRRDGEHVLWLFDEDGSAEGLLVTNALRFLNHSSRPNAEIDGLDLHAIRNIQPGAEILIHYGHDWQDIE
jgi:SET domain-containing protein